MAKNRFLDIEISGIHAAALILGAAGLMSRLAGALRNRLLFAEFGAGRELDIYYAAFQIPDFLATLFLLGAASAAILPIFQEYLVADRKKAEEFIAGLSLLFAAAALGVSAVMFFATPAIVPFVAPGFSAGERTLMTSLTRLMLLSPVLFGLSGIFSVVIQSFRLFFVYALAPLLYNLGIIIGILFFVPTFGVQGLGMGVVLGAALHCALQFTFAARLGFRPFIPDVVRNKSFRKPSFRTTSGMGIRRVFRLSFPRVLALSLSQITVLALVALGSTLARGSVAVFSAAHDLYFLPIGVFAAGYAVAVFPRLAEAAAARSGADFFAQLLAGIRGILFWVAPSATLAIVLRAHIVRAALGAGAFSWEDTRLTAAALAPMALAMAAGAAHILLIRGFYALGNTRVPLIITAATSACTIAMGYGAATLLAGSGAAGHQIALLFRIGDLPHPEVLGLGIAFAAGTVINAVMLYVMLLRAAERRFGMPAPAQRTDMIQIAGAAAVAGIAAYAVRASFSETLPLITFARVLIQGAVAAGVGFAVYWAALSWLGNQEVAMLRRAMMRHLFSRRLLPKEWGGENGLV